MADAWLMRRTSSEGSPVHGESAATRARPLSITAVTPSMVTELSATLVDRITLRPVGGRHGAVLLGRRKIAVKRQDQQAQSRRQWLDRSRGPPDLGGAGQEYQHVAGDAALRETLERRGHLLFERRGRVRRVLDREIVQLAFRAQDRAVAQVLRNGRGVERRRHDDQPQIGLVLLQPPQQRQRQIGIEMPLMKLVQDHRADAGQRGIGQQPPRQHAFGQEPQARARTADVFEAHLIADGFADALAEFAGDAPGRHARRQRRGSSTSTSPRSRASSAGGTRVVFPAPGGASITRFGCVESLDDPRQQIVDRKLHSFESTARMVSGALPSRRLLTKM